MEGGGIYYWGFFTSWGNRYRVSLRRGIERNPKGEFLGGGGRRVAVRGWESRIGSPNHWDGKGILTISSFYLEVRVRMQVCMRA